MKNEKRKLFLNIEMTNFILYNFDKNTIGEKILEENKLELEKILKTKNLDDFNFYLIDTKGFKKNQKNITKLKIKNNVFFWIFIQNQKASLFFLPKTSIQNEQNTNKIPKKKLEDELLEKRNNYLDNKNSENSYSTKNISISVYFYDYNNRLYIKYSSTLNDKQLTIHGKPDIIIKIQNIISKIYCDAKNPMVDHLFISSGPKPSYFIIIKTNDAQHIIGFKNNDKFKVLKNGLDSAITKYNNFKTDIDLEININKLKKEITQSEYNIIDNYLELTDFLKNNQKMKIFFSLFEDKKIPKLIYDITLYQYSIKKNNYKEAIIKLYEILDMINQNNNETDKNKKSKICEVINNEKLNAYLNIYNKANNLINLQNNQELKNILKFNLFDESMILLNQKFIIPALDDYKKPSQINDKTEARKNLLDLVCNYYLKLFNMNHKDSFLEIK